MLTRLIRLLEEAEAPLSLGELSTRLRLPFMSVAYLLANATRAGIVETLPGGRYAAQASTEPLTSSLRELMECVVACEAEWRFDDRSALSRAASDAVE